MSGCAICVHDLFTESMETYTKTLDSLREALRAKAVPEDEWPAQLVVSGTGAKVARKDVSLSAFEQMEMQLAVRKNEMPERLV